VANDIRQEVTSPGDAISGLHGISGAGTQVATPGEDMVTVVLGTWLVAGTLLDAWAHVNIITELESFFTPWHAALYSGFVATACWTFWLAYRRRRGDPRWWRTRWPIGYAAGALGAVMFIVAGVGDLIWHTFLGIENGLDAAFSPTHFGVSVGGALLLTSPVRSWWATGSGPRRQVSGLASLALGTVYGTVLVSSALVLMAAPATHHYDHVRLSPSYLDAAYGLAQYLMSTVLLAIPVLLVHRRRAVFGTATAVLAVVSLFSLAEIEFPRVETAAAIGATVGAVLADAVLLRLDAVRGRDAPLRLPAAGAAFAALVWSGHIAGVALAGTIRWPVELWSGTIVVNALLGAALGGLAARPRSAPDLPLRVHRRASNVPLASDPSTGG
jgi:hypothetical protein